MGLSPYQRQQDHGTLPYAAQDCQLRIAWQQLSRVSGRGLPQFYLETPGTEPRTCHQLVYYNSIHVLNYVFQIIYQLVLWHFILQAALRHVTKV